MGQLLTNFGAIRTTAIMASLFCAGTFSATAQSTMTRARTVLVGNNLGPGSSVVSAYSREGSGSGPSSRRAATSRSGSSTDRLRSALADLKVERIEIAAKYRADTLPMQRIDQKIEQLEKLLRGSEPAKRRADKKADGERYEVVLADLRLQHTYLAARYRPDSEPMVSMQRRIDTLESLMKAEGMDVSRSEADGEADLERLQIVLTDLKLKQAEMAMKYKPQSAPMRDADAQVRAMERKVARARLATGIKYDEKSRDEVLTRLDDMLFDLKIQEVDLSLRYKATSEPMAELRRRISSVEKLIEEETSFKKDRPAFPVADASHGF